jgi:alkanesulfonate monooxygenase SsuD/methylene tetrahydromethanopterin reductase-like flavin-dependent oxidoreductase (luciferase family)
MASPTFGIFDHIEALPGTDTAGVLRDRLDLVRMADQAGFTGFYFAEHHGSELCLAPNQEMVVAAASQITTTIRMGPMVKLLPLHHPVRIVEDMCIVDNLTNGRLEFGVGRGVAPIEHYWFGSDWPNSTDRFEDVLGIVARALRTGEISSAESKYYDFRTMPMATFPVQERIPFWYPGSPATAGRFGMKLMFPGPIPQDAYDLYVETWHAHRDDPVRFDGPADRPTVGSTMVMAIDRDEATARDTMTRAINGLTRRTHAVHRWDAEVLGDEAAEAALIPLQRILSRKEAMIESGYGTPAKVTDRLGEVVADGRVDHFVIQVPTGDMTLDEAKQTLDLFCSEVQPVLETI